MLIFTKEILTLIYWRKMKQLANNKKAFHDYFIEKKYEAGIELKGSEVKSIKQGKVSIKESFIGDRNVCFLRNFIQSCFQPYLVFYNIF